MKKNKGCSIDMYLDKVGKEKEFIASLKFDPSQIIGIVKQSINEWDSMGLLALDCPDDEYDAEIRRLSIFIIKHWNELDILILEQQMRGIFEDAFGEVMTRNPKSIEAANKIYADLVKVQSDGRWV
ncbi:hypothetical protein J2Z22_004632 [Paenibacillus forsythiae]|uniref:Uncharacterized protein n=1 Tax=Paenibacillus forsythiae TaxID=365616 RepID=A0ABU3HDZ4_9BACL|nr:hypothetical protein [Paenibacillus forsythiae]MDT3429036.1 hypothetical protein [Paenibacillus forsythiae]